MLDNMPSLGRDQKENLKPPVLPGNLARQSLIFLAFGTFLGLCFSTVLIDLFHYSWDSELYSHILLIPFISAYLIWINRQALPSRVRPGLREALAPGLLACGLLAGYLLALRLGWHPHRDDRLCILTLTFLLFLLSGGLALLGIAALRPITFPVAFLLFMVPFPDFMHQAIESFFQHGSADMAYFFLSISGMPIIRAGTAFSLPGFQLVVAPECSGIHSSLVLFITSWIAGYLFFKARWRRLLLVCAVIPLALVRNGLRIFTIAQLCVHVDPEMINSPIHTRGGPIFFALSLIPFFLLVYSLRKQEVGQGNPDANWRGNLVKA